MKYYLCEHCGNIIEKIEDSGVPVICCGQPMTLLLPGTTDASAEKHVPVIKIDGSKVTVLIGAAEHPMIPEHYIQWIALETKKGMQRVALKPSDAPRAEFMMLDGDEVVAAYAYCNLHRLWKA